MEFSTSPLAIFKNNGQKPAAVADAPWFIANFLMVFQKIFPKFFGIKTLKNQNIWDNAVALSLLMVAINVSEPNGFGTICDLF